MGRKKGGKNAPGHSAGGARKGAGRPRKDGSKARAKSASETYDSILNPHDGPLTFSSHYKREDFDADECKFAIHVRSWNLFDLR